MHITMPTVTVPPNVVMAASLGMRGLSFAAWQLTRASEALPTLRWGSSTDGVSDALMDSGLVYGRPTSSLRTVAAWAREAGVARADELVELASRVRIWQELLLADAARVSIVEQTRAKEPGADPNDLLKPPSQLPVMRAIRERLADARSEALAGVRLLTDVLAEHPPASTVARVPLA